MRNEVLQWHVEVAGGFGVEQWTGTEGFKAQFRRKQIWLYKNGHFGIIKIVGACFEDILEIGITYR